MNKPIRNSPPCLLSSHVEESPTRVLNFIESYSSLLFKSLSSLPRTKVFCTGIGSVRLASFVHA
jgi:hypothetical protein